MSSKSRREEFVAGVASLRSGFHGAPRGRFYTAELRALGVSYAQERVTEGASVWTVAEELGIHEQTLERWMHGPGSRCHRGSRRARISRVRVVADHRAADSDIVLTAGAVEVSGLSVDAIVDILRALT